MVKAQWATIRRQHVKKHGVIYIIVIFVFLVGIMAGAFTVGFLPEQQLLGLRRYFDGFFYMLDSTALDQGTILRQSMASHLQSGILLAIMGISVVGIPFLLLVDMLRGFAVGFTAGCLVGGYGFQGVWWMLLSLLPSNIILIPATILLSVLGIRHATTNYASRKKLPIVQRRKMLQTYLSYALICLLVMFAGVLVESFLTPLLLTWLK